MKNGIGKMIEIDLLVPWNENPRVNKHAVNAVAKSIKEFGFAAPIVARSEDNMIICGHTRFLATQQLKLDRIPVRFMDLSLEDAKRLAIADNKTGELALWDDEKLKELLSSFDAPDLEVLGFDDDELEEMLTIFDPPPAPDPIPKPEPIENSDFEFTLLKGDCLETLKTLPDNSIDAIITSGGTGLTGRDSTPEAIKDISNKIIEGFGELFRQISYEKIGTSTIQSRSVAAVIKDTYVFALPGSTNACNDAWEKILKFQLDIRYKPCNFIEIMPRLKEK